MRRIHKLSDIITLQTLPVPRAFLDLLDELRARNAALCAARGSTDDSRSVRQGPGGLMVE